MSLPLYRESPNNDDSWQTVFGGQIGLTFKEKIKFLKIAKCNGTIRQVSAILKPQRAPNTWPKIIFQWRLHYSNLLYLGTPNAFRNELLLLGCSHLARLQLRLLLLCTLLFSAPSSLPNNFKEFCCRIETHIWTL